MGWGKPPTSSVPRVSSLLGTWGWPYDCIALCHVHQRYPGTGKIQQRDVEGFIVILLMEEILHQLVDSLFTIYKPFIQSLHIPGVAGFLPSTVWMRLLIFYFAHLFSRNRRDSWDSVPILPLYESAFILCGNTSGLCIVDCSRKAACSQEHCNIALCVVERPARWWFQISFIFTPIWGRFPIWLIFFRWVETTT